MCLITWEREREREREKKRERERESGAREIIKEIKRIIASELHFYVCPL